MAFYDLPTLRPALFNQRDKNNASVIDSEALSDQQREYELWVRLNQCGIRYTFCCTSISSELGGLDLDVIPAVVHVDSLCTN